MKILAFVLVLFSQILAFEASEFCAFSGENLNEFKPFSHEVRTKDGEILTYCTLGELAYDSLSVDILFSSIKVRDFISGEILSVDEIYYVTGSDLGLEVAFGDKNRALKFSQTHGGKVVSFDLAYDDGLLRVSKALEKTRHKNSKKFLPMGERIYRARCPKIEPNLAINVLKAKALNECENLNFTQALLVAKFLLNQKDKKTLNLDKSHKCPVCGMFVYKYPRWVAVVEALDKNGAKKTLYFDGVKDMMKFIFDKDSFGGFGFEIENTYATSYYTGDLVRVEDAFFVYGSDVLGPMGRELVAFENLESAKSFMLEHKGVKIYKFSEISKSLICELDSKRCE